MVNHTPLKHVVKYQKSIGLLAKIIGGGKTEQVEVAILMTFGLHVRLHENVTILLASCAVLQKKNADES